MAQRKKSPGKKRVPKTGQEGRVEAVNFDFGRSLINVLGEEHYPYAEFLYHELAANSWDSDATEVHIQEESIRAPSKGRAALYNITVRDNGNGMDLPGIREYFKVGDSAKRTNRETERLGRPVIGRIGVGKVAILKVARRWKITSERHLGLDAPVRLTVHVDIDQWINEEISAFAVQFLEPTGHPGTEIVLEGAQTRLRQDRILRHLRRLPLGDDFTVWRNGTLVTPRHWHGIDSIDVNTEAEWTDDDGLTKRGSIRGEIWIRPPSSRRDAAFIEEPTNEKDGMRREAAGIEVRVDQDMIVREFFGHETHGHQVNRIWGWVEVPWLPILGNRTDYLRDSPAGHAFYEALRPLFDEAFKKVRYEESKSKKNKKNGETGGDGDSGKSSSDARADTNNQGSKDSKPTESDETVASRYGEVINEILEGKPELAPVLTGEAEKGRGRPAKDRIYPVRFRDNNKPFEPGPYGEDLAVTSEKVTSATTRAIPGQVRASKNEEIEELPIGERTINTRAGVKLRFAALGGLEAPYRWNLDYSDDDSELTLDINTDHKLYAQTGRAGNPMHRLHCAWIVAMALAEKNSSTIGQQFAETIESLSYELFRDWKS